MTFEHMFLICFYPKGMFSFVWLHTKENSTDLNILCNNKLKGSLCLLRDMPWALYRKITKDLLIGKFCKRSLKSCCFLFYHFSSFYSIWSYSDNPAWGVEATVKACFWDNYRGQFRQCDMLTTRQSFLVLQTCQPSVCNTYTYILITHSLVTLFKTL